MRREEILAMDPFRPPWWRHDLAVKIARGEKRPRRQVDPVVKAVVDLLRARERTTPGRGAHEHDADLAAALRLHEEDGPRRWEVEARVVAGQSDQEIAHRCGLRSTVIAYYTQVFLDIRQCLEATDYLMTKVVGRWTWDAFRNEDVGRFWAWAALARGPRVLDSLIAVFNAARRPREVPTMAIYLHANKGVPPEMQAFVAASVLPEHGPIINAYVWWGLWLHKARVVGDPVQAERVRERVRDDIIRCARAVLAGKPPPRSRLLPRKPSNREHEEGDVRAITAGSSTVPAMSPEILARFFKTVTVVNGCRN